jgi:hypothetical protein
LAEVSSDPALKRHLRPFASQIITFAPPQANSRNTAAEVITMALYPKYADSKADRDANRPCLPAMAEAAIVLPMIRQFGGQKNPATGAIEPTRAMYADAYRQHGFDEGNAGQLCLRLPDGVALNFGPDNRPDQAGGLACPSMRVGALSRSQGAAGATSKGSTIEDTDLAALAANTFDPASYFNSSTATLLGVIKLPEILQKATVIPQWSTVGEGTAIIHQLVWDTAVPTSTDIFISKTTTRLLLKIAVKIQADGAAASTIQGTLTDFGIFLGGIIGLNFKSLQFFMPTGGKPVVHVELAGQGVAFDGPLTFLQALQDHLGLENFTDPPSLEVSAEGITAGYSLSIPTIAVGAFALQNLALSAGLNLPFTGAPIRARFALSERHNPFLVTVSLFTGGGFFGVIVGPDGVHLLEACLEFGGCFSLNLGVASGGVYVMAGIYIQIADKESQLSGYVRAGGALEVLGLITVSVEFYLELSYLEPKTARGQASLTVKVEVLFFSKSVTLTVERTFTSGSRDIGFSEMMNKEQWHTYLGAFAEEGQ